MRRASRVHYKNIDIVSFSFTPFASVLEYNIQMNGWEDEQTQTKTCRLDFFLTNQQKSRYGTVSKKYIIRIVELFLALPFFMLVLFLILIHSIVYWNGITQRLTYAVLIHIHFKMEWFSPSLSNANYKIFSKIEKHTQTHKHTHGGIEITVAKTRDNCFNVVDLCLQFLYVCRVFVYARAEQAVNYLKRTLQIFCSLIRGVLVLTLSNRSQSTLHWNDRDTRNTQHAL